MRYPAISSPSGKGALFCAAILKSSLHNTAIVWINVGLVKNKKPGTLVSISSMTGYAVATSEGAAGTLTIEIKSVNSRFLDLQFRINDELRALEPDLRSAIMAAITRGKVEARLSYGRKAASGSQALNQVLLADLARL